MFRSVLGDAVDFMVMRPDPTDQLRARGVFQGGLKARQLLVGLEVVKAFAWLEHTSGGSAKRHLRIAQALHISTDLTHYRGVRWLDFFGCRLDPGIHV